MLGKSAQYIIIDDPEDGVSVEALSVGDPDVEKHYIQGTSAYYCEHPKCANTFTFFNLHKGVLIFLMTKKVIPIPMVSLGDNEEYCIQCLGVQQRNKLIKAIETYYS